MSSRPRGEDEDYDEYRLSLRTVARLMKKRLAGRFLYAHLPNDKNKKPYRKPTEEEL